MPPAALAALELGGDGRGFVGDGRREDVVALLQCLFGLFVEALRLFILRLAIGTQSPIVDAIEIAGGFAHDFTDATVGGSVDLGGMELSFSPSDHTGLVYTDMSIISEDGKFRR